MKSLTAAQMRELDLRTEKEFQISSLDLMENAGRATANAAIKIISENLRRPLAQSLAVICCGRGNNGGDGLVAARHLKKAGVAVEVYCLAPTEKKAFKPEFKAQLERARKEGLTPKMIVTPETITAGLSEAALVIDALLGTGSKGKPMGLVHKVIQKIMKAKKPILALDIPSGIDADTGYHSGVYIQADWTLTLGAAKTGLLKPHARRYVGELMVADIGHPKKLLEEYSKA